MVLTAKYLAIFLVIFISVLLAYQRGYKDALSATCKGTSYDAVVAKNTIEDAVTSGYGIKF